MYHSEWFKLRYELIRDYPHRKYAVGEIIGACNIGSDFSNKVTLNGDGNINPNDYKDHFRLLNWWEHRTIEQLLTIKYARIVSDVNYYVIGDIVEVRFVSYNDASIVGGENELLFNLKGHYFTARSIEPATKKEHDEFWEKEKVK